MEKQISADGKPSPLLLNLSKEDHDILVKATMDYSRNNNLFISRQKMIVNMIRYYSENFKNK